MGKRKIQRLMLTSSNPAPNLRKSDTIAPAPLNYFVTGSGSLHMLPHHFLPPSPAQKGR